VTDSDALSADATPPQVSALRASPERVVLTETDNADGWIATDAAVTLDEIR
jgi:hypothetical protein